jgi:hypothetical protein
MPTAIITSDTQLNGRTDLFRVKYGDTTPGQMSTLPNPSGANHSQIQIEISVSKI